MPIIHEETLNLSLTNDNSLYRGVLGGAATVTPLTPHPLFILYMHVCTSVCTPTNPISQHHPHYPSHFIPFHSEKGCDWWWLVCRFAHVFWNNSKAAVAPTWRTLERATVLVLNLLFFLNWLTDASNNRNAYIKPMGWVGLLCANKLWAP